MPEGSRHAVVKVAGEVVQRQRRRDHHDRRGEGFIGQFKRIGERFLHDAPYRSDWLKVDRDISVAKMLVVVPAESETNCWQNKIDG